MRLTDFPKLSEMIGAHPLLAQTVRLSQSGQCPTEMGKAFDTVYNKYKRYRTFTDEEDEFFEAFQQRLDRWYGKYKPIFDVINTINGFKKTVDWDIDKTSNNLHTTNDTVSGSSTDTTTSKSTEFNSEETTYNGSTRSVEQPTGKHTVTKEFGNGVNSTVLGEEDTALGATDTYEYGSTTTDTGFNNRYDDTASSSVNNLSGTDNNSFNNTRSGNDNFNGITNIDQDITTTDTEKTLAMMYKRYGINSFGEELLLIVSDLFLGVY